MTRNILEDNQKKDQIPLVTRILVPKENPLLFVRIRKIKDRAKNYTFLDCAPNITKPSLPQIRDKVMFLLMKAILIDRRQVKQCYHDR